MFSRLVRLVGVTIKHGLFWWLIPRLWRSDSPERLRLALEEMGGAWIKLGQALALRFDVMPARYCEELFKLLDQVKPDLDKQTVQKIIKTELDRVADELLQSFDWNPHASASIGQVHRSRLPTGRQVAVKVQRPKIRNVIRADVAIMYLIALLCDKLDLFGMNHTREIVDEFARWTAEELDYTIEAAHAENLIRNQGDDGLENNACVFWDYTSARVLTTEFLAGPSVNKILEASRGKSDRHITLDGREYDRESIALHINWNLLNQMFVFGYFHADLHPANMIVLPYDEIGYVDFGITGQVSPELRESLIYYAWNLYKGDAERAADEFLRWVTPASAADLPAARVELMGIIRKYLDSLAAKRRKPDASRPESAELEALDMVRRYRMTVAPAVVLCLKAMVTANTVVFELAPNYDMRGNQVKFLRRMFSRLACDALRPSQILPEVFDYAHQMRRTWRTIQGVVNSVMLQVSAKPPVLGWKTLTSAAVLFLAALAYGAWRTGVLTRLEKSMALGYGMLWLGIVGLIVLFVLFQMLREHKIISLRSVTNRLSVHSR